MIRSMLSRAFGAPLGTAWARQAAWALLAIVTASCQSSDGDPPIGGETHFLKCISDSDCRSLSEEHLCIDRVCELPSTASDDAGPIEVAVPDAAIACGGTALNTSEMVILGDSFFATTHEITGHLETLAREASVLATNENLRDYSGLTDNAFAFMGGNGIADQYSEALADGDVRVVVMNGGGADALIGDCASGDAGCPWLDEAAMAAADLFAQMASDGVADIVYVSYPDPLDDATRGKVDALRPLIQSACTEAPTRCHFMDLRTTFEGRYDEFIRPDGLNPTSAGSEATAAEIWDVMQAGCVGR